MVEHFSHQEAKKKKCNMVLSPQGQEDKLTWIVGTPSGQFSVKSAYHSEKARALSIKGECSKNSNPSGIWKSLWKMRVIGVVTNFLWRVCNNLLPTNENLCRKGIVNDHILWTVFRDNGSYFIELQFIYYCVDGMREKNTETLHLGT